MVTLREEDTEESMYKESTENSQLREDNSEENQQCENTEDSANCVRRGIENTSNVRRAQKVANIVMRGTEKYQN